MGLSKKEEPIIIDLLGTILKTVGSLVDVIILMLFIFGTVLNLFKMRTK